MVISVSVNPANVTTYHAENISAVSRIQSTDRYVELKADINRNGIKDPLLVRCEKGRIYVECGEERTFIARELGIKSVSAIVYDTGGGVIPKAWIDTGKFLKTIADIEACFSRTEYEETTHETCSECGTDLGEETHTVMVPTLKMILDYVASGVACLN